MKGRESNDEFKKARVWMRAGGLLIAALIACATLTFAQSKDRDNPTPLTSNLLKGPVEPGLGECFFSFPAGPGEVKATLDVTATEGSYAPVDVHMYDEDANQLVELVVEPSPPMTDRKIGRFRLVRRETVTMGVVIDQGWQSIGSYQVRLEGAVQLPKPVAPAPAQPIANTAETAPAQPAAPVQSAAPAQSQPGPSACTLPLGKTTEMRVKLLGPVSTETSQKGDKITAQVLSPDQCKGASVEGKVTDSKSGSRYKGKSTLGLSFDTLQLQNQAVPIRGVVKSVINSQGAPDVDEEGHVIKKTSNVKWAAAGAGAGAVLGGLLGGAKGAAIGAGAGAAVSLAAIRVAVKAPSISFAPGSVFILGVSAPR